MARQNGTKKPNPIAAFFGFGLGKPTSGAPQEKQRVRPSASSAAKDSPDTPVAAHSFSGHFITFALVLVIIALSVYSPVTSFIKQHQEIKATKEHIAALQRQQQDLQGQVSLWEDDNYVKQQARSRLFYVAPGETPYLVVGLDATSELADDTSAVAKTAPEDSWTTKLWGSLQLASEGNAGPGASPSAEPTAGATTSPAATPSSQPAP